jgi:glycosyltransferase involved in cell wall biosynthesis
MDALELGAPPPHQRIAVLIPCCNEQSTIADVVRRFKTQLPKADIYVFDNNSTDDTIGEATRAGAIIRHEKRQGKGYVLRSMFRQVDADVYVMVDGDGTYPAEKVHELIAPVLADEADMVVGSRLQAGAASRFKVLNRIGNYAFRMILNLLFRVHITDLLSGYRAMNKRFVKSLPFLSHGFESETELTVKCLARGFRIVEIPVRLVPRPAGSYSKIRLVRDGLLISETLLALARDYKPLTAFGAIGLALIGCGLIPGVVVISEFLRTGYIRHLPSAVLATGLVLSGLLVGFVGLVLHTIARHFQELDYQMQELLGYHLTDPETKARDRPPSDAQRKPHHP